MLSGLRGGCHAKQPLQTDPNESGVPSYVSVRQYEQQQRLLMRVISGSEKSGEDWWDEFRDLLDDQNDWPTEYTFKFIAPSPRLDALKDVFGDHPVQVRSSRKGNYMSVTARMHMESSDEVVAIYEEASSIDDVISL